MPMPWFGSRLAVGKSTAADIYILSARDVREKIHEGMRRSCHSQIGARL